MTTFSIKATKKIRKHSSYKNVLSPSDTDLLQLIFSTFVGGIFICKKAKKTNTPLPLIQLLYLAELRRRSSVLFPVLFNPPAVSLAPGKMCDNRPLEGGRGGGENPPVRVQLHQEKEMIIRHFLVKKENKKRGWGGMREEPETSVTSAAVTKSRRDAVTSSDCRFICMSSVVHRRGGKSD